MSPSKDIQIVKLTKSQKQHCRRSFLQAVNSNLNPTAHSFNNLSLSLALFAYHVLPETKHFIVTSSEIHKTKVKGYWLTIYLKFDKVERKVNKCQETRNVRDVLFVICSIAGIGLHKKIQT